MIAEIQAKIELDVQRAAQRVRQWSAEGQRVVFTNGCFDLLHYGHIHYLAEARELGARLVIGLNDAASVSRLKGPGRPINDEQTRLWQMAALQFVDLVVPFSEDTPLLLIRALRPDVLVKGGDYSIATIVGAEEVLSRGGQVEVLPYIEGYSTTSIEAKIRKGH
ncbi:D-glycero-beta-D-manno-heptose 1-phosphate adenylyltransferase [Phaeodactylibacter luteus]|uniref:D-glycero-beta-D-manno-heptose 1-phosphate adenylyltransferase n=1 Tax=Phaeodactylibacter luteus TaxID=1564516 RepID=A0A5C6RJC2_9BACT|nr:D-glycero-beta-D-manno-heptose 1-phosphate adenylyltransferase [Phaeodactylibacter luteus]TXB62024.1 D-glycero-beta-D-manno-heptose 1-phosphate adenylyltransferase [Phaeodactylibacter luteus]